VIFAVYDGAGVASQLRRITVPSVFGVERRPFPRSPIEESRMTATIRPVSSADVEQIVEIYNHYVLASTITFEEEPVEVPEMARRILEVGSVPLPWLVAVSDSGVQGYAYASKWKARSAYRFSVESTVYLREGSFGQGIGSQLYEHLIAALQVAGVHAIIGGVALPNDASLRLHQKLGFEKVAHFREVGFKFDRWIDVTYWERVLNP
jgi:L-amino acid N-acyltransferase YncA